MDLFPGPEQEEEKDALEYSPYENVPGMSCFWLACEYPKDHQNAA